MLYFMASLSVLSKDLSFVVFKDNFHVYKACTLSDPHYERRGRLSKKIAASRLKSILMVFTIARVS